MDEKELLEYLHKKAKYSKEKSVENKKNGMIRVSEWYDGQYQAFLTVINLVENKKT